MMTSKRFFQYVEDSGLRAYDGLVAQNHDHVRNEKNRTHFQEKNDKKRKQEEAIKRTGEDVVAEGKHLRMGSMTMPAPPDRLAQHGCGTGGFAVRSQSLHSVGGGEEEGSPTSRKQPPPKPRRDPNTKLSISSEAVDLTMSSCRGGDSDRCDAAQGCSEDCRRVPPPKPKRNPNTQLSTSFDESYIRSHGPKGSPPAPSPPRPRSPGRDSDPDEPVYIEMAGSGEVAAQRGEGDEPGEAVYEEMKYPALDELEAARRELAGHRSQCATPCPPEGEALGRCATPRGAPPCDIPAPFPNLLAHRPPLLVFPPAPAQCSPNSDESPLTPLDALAKLPALENAPYGKLPAPASAEHPAPPASSSARRAERELAATPTLTVSGRSSAPPLPCAPHKGSAPAHGYQRSHSACPSPVSAGRCLTPLSLMRAPPFDGPFPGAGLPRSASATPHGKGSPPQEAGPGGGRLHGSMQNVSAGRSRTPTSPLDELTNLFTTGRNMLKKNTSGRKSKEPAEAEAKGRCQSSESKRDHKERSHHGKESKRDKERSGNGKDSSHRRNSKDKGCNGTEALPRRDSKDKGCGGVEPLPRRDSKDRSNGPELLPRQDGKDRGCNSVEPLPRRDSKDKGCGGVEPLPRRDSKDRSNGPELLPRQDGKEPTRNGCVDARRDSRERSGHGSEFGSRTGPESWRDVRDRGGHGAECRCDGKDRSSNGTDFLSRRDGKDRERHEGKDRGANPADLSKSNEWDAASGQPSAVTPSRPGRPSVSPTVASGTSNSELKTVPKVGRSPSTPVAPSPLGTPQRLPAEAQPSQVPAMPWGYGDSAMLEMIERKQRLCREIRSRLRPPSRSPCKQESLPALPGWRKSNGTKKYGPPPYPAQATVLWDTAI